MDRIVIDQLAPKLRAGGFQVAWGAEASQPGFTNSFS
jgi:hypothetical protein